MLEKIAKIIYFSLFDRSRIIFLLLFFLAFFVSFGICEKHEYWGMERGPAVAPRHLILINSA